MSEIDVISSNTEFWFFIAKFSAFTIVIMGSVWLAIREYMRRK